MLQPKDLARQWYVRVVGADLPFFVSVLQAQGIHGAHDCSQGLDGVAVNNRLVLLYIIAGETVLMDDPGHKGRYRVRSADKTDTQEK